MDVNDRLAMPGDICGEREPASGSSDDGVPWRGVWTVVAAAGAGRRFGDSKQFSELCGALVLDWTVMSATRWSEGVVVVVPAAGSGDAHRWSAERCSLLSEHRAEVLVVAGGVARSDSVRCGLAQVPDSAEIVLVHDGARPLADDGVYTRVIDSVRSGADAAVPVVDIADSLRWRDGAAADRSRLVAVQTPQGFQADVLRAAHASGGDATDDATLVESAGGKIVMVDGDPRNLKITEPHDLALAETLLEARRATHREGVSGD